MTVVKIGAMKIIIYLRAQIRASRRSCPIRVKFHFPYLHIMLFGILDFTEYQKMKGRSTS